MWFVVMVLVWAIDGFCVGVVAVGRGSLLAMFQFLGPFGGG